MALLEPAAGLRQLGRLDAPGIELDQPFARPFALSN
jgi:hypothetical protein